MPDSGNFQTVGNPISNASIGSVGTNFSRVLRNNNNVKFRYRVTEVFFDEKGNCTHIKYEDTFRNYGKSPLGTVENNAIAYTSNSNIQIIPEVGEYIELFNAAEAYSAASNKSSPVQKTYWKSTEGSLNIWDTFEGDNKNLDPTVPGQATNNQMTSLNVGNYNKSLTGMVPRQREEIKKPENKIFLEQTSNLTTQYESSGTRSCFFDSCRVDIKVINKKTGEIIISKGVEGTDVSSLYLQVIKLIQNDLISRGITGVILPTLKELQETKY
jgi:hypothetical protein